MTINAKMYMKFKLWAYIKSLFKDNKTKFF